MSGRPCQTAGQRLVATVVFARGSGRQNAVTTTEDRYRVQSVERAFVLLEALAEAGPEGMILSDLARLLGHQPLQQGGGLVVAVVDEAELGVDALQGAAEPLDQGTDVARLVARGDHHAEEHLVGHGATKHTCAPSPEPTHDGAPPLTAV